MMLARKSWPLSIALVIALALPGPGCGGSPEFDKTAQYTPESLAQDLAFRFRALSPAAKITTKTRRRTPKKTATFVSDDEKSQTKTKSKESTKKALAKTADDLLDEIDAKASLIKGVSRAEVFTKMSEAISRDNSLKESERQPLAERLKEMGNG
jgi:hypothetical protein